MVPYPLLPFFVSFFFFNDTATTEIYTLSLHDALPISARRRRRRARVQRQRAGRPHGERADRSRAQALEHLARPAEPGQNRMLALMLYAVTSPVLSASRLTFITRNLVPTPTKPLLRPNFSPCRKGMPLGSLLTQTLPIPAYGVTKPKPLEIETSSPRVSSAIWSTPLSLVRLPRTPIAGATASPSMMA